MEKPLERLELLINEDGINKLANSKVMVVGVGGVGGYVCEALARSGIGELILMDNDVVGISNINRQIIATYKTIGQYKTEAMKERIESFASCKVTCINGFFDESTKIDSDVDYVCDCIDTVTSKFELIKKCHDLNIKSISSLGMANRFDPSKIVRIPLAKTENDPLAKAMRLIVKKNHYNYPISCIFSKELPVKQNKLVNPDGKTMKEKYPPASNAFVPSAAGLLMASCVVRDILNIK